MSGFKAKMHQIVCRLGSASDPAGGAFKVLLQTLSWILGNLLLRERRGGEGRGGDSLLYTPSTTL